MEFSIDPDPANPPKKGSALIEVLIDDISPTHLWVRVDEKSVQRKIPIQGIRILKMDAPYATLRLSERKAIAYSLV